MSPKPRNAVSASSLTLSKRELLLGMLASAIILATPQSRLMAASQLKPVRLALGNGKTLEVHKEEVFLLDGARRQPVRQGVFSLASGGRIEVRNGQVIAAAMGPGDPFVKATWIEIHSPPGGKPPVANAADWLQSNGKRRLGQ
jgi:hypothetical protein